MAEVPNRTIKRGLTMLELLGAHPEGLALCELAEALNLPRSTAFNLAHTLTRLDYAWYNEDTGKYALGLKMFEIGSSAINRIDVMKVVRGAMAQIHREVNETMHLGIASDREMLYIDKMESTRSIRMSSYVGSRAPLYCTALGKAVLSTMRDEQVTKMYRHTILQAMTPRTITSVPLLIEQLALIRQKGYAVEREEYNEGVCCAAVALRDGEGRAVYALSVSAPVFRVGEAEFEHYAELLLIAQQRIERFLKGGQTK